MIKKIRKMMIIVDDTSLSSPKVLPTILVQTSSILNNNGIP